MLRGTRFKNFIKCLVQLKGNLIVHNLRWGTFPTLFMDRFKGYIAVKWHHTTLEVVFFFAFSVLWWFLNFFWSSGFGLRTHLSLSICPSVHLSICPSFHPSLKVYVSPSSCLPFLWLFLCPCLCPSVNLSLLLSISQSICQSTFLFISLCLSICLLSFFEHLQI